MSFSSFFCLFLPPLLLIGLVNSCVSSGPVNSVVSPLHQLSQTNPFNIICEQSDQDFMLCKSLCVQFILPLSRSMLCSN